MSFYTPLRYPGGKARLGPWIAQLVKHNRISNGIYAEAYAGGAGAAMFLLLRGHVSQIQINDADPVVFAFWMAVTKHTAALAALVRTTPVTMKSWEEQKQILAEPKSHSQLELGFATFFLNRTNRSGILAGGVIGGKAQTGNFKLDARYNKTELISRIEAIGERRRHIKIENLDAKDWLETTGRDLPAESLLYLDPPYFVKGSQLYRNFYQPDDHAAIATAVSELRTPVIVTYDNAPEISALYADVASAHFSLRYSTHIARPESTELMFYKNIELPSSPRLTRGNFLPPAGLDETANVVPHRVHELLT